MNGRRPFVAGLAGLAGALLVPRAIAQAPAVVCCGDRAHARPAHSGSASPARGRGGRMIENLAE